MVKLKDRGIEVLNIEIDTIYLNDILNYHIGGFYKTSNLVGIAERTYTLKVITKEQEIFTATDYMPITAQIDSIGFEKKRIKGFTLLEVLIAIAIFSLVSLSSFTIFE